MLRAYQELDWLTVRPITHAFARVSDTLVKNGAEFIIPYHARQSLRSSKRPMKAHMGAFISGWQPISLFFDMADGASNG